MKKLTSFLCLTLLLLSSCEMMEMEEETVVSPVSMRLERDTIYVMEGETFTVRPVFYPDSVSVSDIYWTTSNDDIVSIADNTFTAVSEGWTTVIGMSVSGQMADTCHVCVFPNRNYSVPVFPYETVFYCSPEIDGKTFDSDNMVLLAYINDMVRGVGEYYEHNGFGYIELGVGHDIFDEDDPDGEYIKFMIYEKTQLTGKYLGFARFDGNTHGSLNSLYLFKK